MNHICLNWHILYEFDLGYDLDGDGKVTLAEFKRVMIKTGRVSPEDIEKMIGRADVDDDG